MSKIKIVWICHFTNDKIQDKLNVRKKINNFAPWISFGIEEIKKRKDIELHVISPHRWISISKTFSEGNISYYFFNPGIPFYGRHWPRFFAIDIWTNYFFNRNIIRKIVSKISPDIVHLHGFENAYYSSSILDLYKSFPTFVTVQGFYSLSATIKKNNLQSKSKLFYENKIIKSIDNFGIRDKQMKQVILEHNPTASFFWHEYFMNIPDEPIENLVENYKYDLVYFAPISKVKGIEDLIEAVAKLTLTFPNIKLAVMGSGNNSYIEDLKKLTRSLNCYENISFLGFQKNQDSVYEKLYLSKIAVLPTYNDNVPGLVIESMLRKVPVVTYNTGGIPEINLNNHNIEIVKQGSIDGLVSKIEFLLKNPSYRFKLAEKAFQYAIVRWNNRKALDDIIDAYIKIIN